MDRGLVRVFLVQESKRPEQRISQKRGNGNAYVVRCTIASLTEKDIFWFEVPVNETLFVTVVDTAQQVIHQVSGICFGELGAFDNFVK